MSGFSGVHWANDLPDGRKANPSQVVSADARTSHYGSILLTPDPAMIAALPAAIYTTDAQGRISYFNEAAAALWGCRPELGKNEFCGSWKLFWPDGRPLPHAECPMALALEQKRAIKGMEAIAERPDGRRVHFVAYPTPLFDTSGTLTGAINTLVDITERKLVEGELADIFENGAVAMDCVSADGTILRVNRRQLEMLDYSRDEYVGHHISEFHVSQAAIDDILERLSNGELLSNYEAQLRCKDGSIRDVLIDYSVLWKDGNFVHARCSTRDITAHKRAEEAVQQLASVIANADDAIVGKNLSGIVTSWNKGAERLFGYTAEDMVGKSITVIIPEDRQNEETEILGRIKRAERVEHYETVRRRKDGHFVEVSLTVSPIKDKTGRIVGASKIARDIGERKQAQARQKLLNREIQHRTKNLFAVVQAVVARSFTGKVNVQDAKTAVLSRLHSLAETHIMVADNNWQGAELAEIVHAEMSPYAGRAMINGPSINLGPKGAQNFSLVLHELATNAAKYGALSNATGQVAISWSVVQSNGHGRFNFRWQERGGPPVTPPKHKGFGSMVIERIMAEHCGVVPRVDFAASGLTFDMSSSLEAITSGDGSTGQPPARPNESS